MLSISPVAVDDPNTLPIVAAGQVVYKLMRSLRSSTTCVYVKSSPELIWTPSANMPTSLDQLSRITRVYVADNNTTEAPSETARQHQVVEPSASLPVDKKLSARSDKTKTKAHKRESGSNSVGRENEIQQRGSSLP